MKKVLKSRIFICIIVGICCLGIGVYGATIYPYKANEISYTPSNGETINVNEALNELYSKSNNNTTIIGKYDINSISTPLFLGGASNEIYVLISNGLVGALKGDYLITDISDEKITTISSSNSKKAQDGINAGSGSIIYKLSNIEEQEQPNVKSFTSSTYTIGSFFILEKKDINLIGKYDITSTNTSMTFDKDYEVVYIFISHGLVGSLSGYYTISNIDSTRIKILGRSNNKKAQDGINAGSGAELYMIKNVKENETITINSFTSAAYSIGTFYVMG